MRRFVSILLLICTVQCTLGVFAQDNNAVAQKHAVDAKVADKLRKAEVKKCLDDAKTNFKQNKNLDKTEAAVRKLLKDSANIRDKRLHATLIESLRKQYNQGNEKLYLKQKYDTTSLFVLARKIFVAAQELDSVEALPDTKGKVDFSHRKSDAQLLMQLHGNLYTGGVFLLNHRKYADAVSCMDIYLQSPQWAMMEGGLQPDSLHRQHASYVSLVAGYRAEDFSSALKYEDDALRYRPRLETTLQYLTEIYHEQGNEKRNVELLKLGVDSFPTSHFFFSRLVDVYCDHSDFASALDVTTKAIAADTTAVIPQIVRQTLLLNLSRYDECIALGEKLLAKDDSLAEVNYNIALAYYNQTMGLDQGPAKQRRERERKLHDLYRKCRPYMERYRALEPDKKDRWRPVLYNVYLNLNLGKEFSELSTNN